MTVPRIIAPEPGPATLKERRWGGSRLAALRGVTGPTTEPIGESWELSTLEGSESRALGQPLSRVLGGPLPFLAKLIDTALPLSIQVHPDDDPETGAVGKEEAWIVLDAEPDAYMLAGLAAGSDRSTLASATARALADPRDDGALLGSLRRIEVARGTIVMVPARTPHAIGPGILLAEIQQPSDCTYRVFDYGSGRPLHTERALDTISTDAQPLLWRPGNPSQHLEGKHLSLRPVESGAHELHAARPHLIVSVEGTAALSTPDARSLIPRGELRLVTGGDYRLEVESGGLAVVGWIRD